VEELVRDGLVDQALQRKFEKTRLAVDSILISTLRNHPDATTREVCATILRERRRASSIPELIAAIDDVSEHVRFDALWAIEKCAGLAPAQLSTVLMLTPGQWPEIRRRIRGWWQLVKHDLFFSE
jgi:HEAT repeat protein